MKIQTGDVTCCDGTKPCREEQKISDTLRVSVLSHIMSGAQVLVWIVLVLFTEAASQNDACDSEPCRNGGVCIPTRGDHTCSCSKEPRGGRLYGGPNCTVALRGCERHLCRNGATCWPVLSGGLHRYSCSCAEGFTGSRCEISTTFSFENSGFLYVRGPAADTADLLSATMSFRTLQRSATLLQGIVDDHTLTLQLRSGRPRLVLRRTLDLQPDLVELPRDVADGRWHTVRLFLRSDAFGLRLQDPSCTSSSCHREALVETEPGSGSGLNGSGRIQGVFIGGSWEVPVRPESFFLGCMRDVQVQSRAVLPGSGVEGQQVNVSLGCRENDGCEERPCGNRGRCVGLGWRKHECECHRPYRGDACSQEFPVVRFGGEGAESFGVFTVDEELGDSFVVSMFLRTRRLSGFLLEFSNSTGGYLNVWLVEGGKVRVQAGSSEIVQGHESVSDGRFHLVSVRVEPGSVRLDRSGGALVAPPGLRIRSGDVVRVGGYEDRDASLAFGGYFKGCVQDLRVNEQPLLFYPVSGLVSSYSLERKVEVTPGCTADDSCRTNPCLNGGVCYSVWDDFTCSCPPNTAGRHCEQLRWCELSPCPPAAVCRSHGAGFDCVLNVTLREGAGDRVLTYRGNGGVRRPLHGASLRFRTRRRFATLLHAAGGNRFITVAIQDGRLVLELRGGSGSSSVRLQSRRALVSDGNWHSATMTMVDPSAPASEWSMVLDERRDESSVSSSVSGDLSFLREGVDISVGGADPDSGADFDGCLGTVEIGGLLLPFHSESELGVARPQEERFLKVSGTPDAGCRGAEVCDPNPCGDEGRCEDLFDLFECRCADGWRGRLCEDGSDACGSNPCVRGSCVPVGDGYGCVCEPGYAGQRCREERDVCEGHGCRNGGTCLRGLGRYACLCPRNTTGAHCQERVPEAPWYVDRVPSPTLPVMVCGNEKWNYSCFHGGNCSASQDVCDCLPGFTGQWCELEVNECASDPCMNGGFCRDLVNRFQCVCELSFAGELCQMDVSDFYLYVFLLMWQNIFQLLSYLILRLDDEPEVEWDAANDD